MIAAPHLRELICSELTSKSLHIYRNRYTRLGIPVYDVYKRLANGCGAVLDQDFNYESSYSWIVGQVMEQFVHLNQLSEEEREFHLKEGVHSQTRYGIGVMSRMDHVLFIGIPY